MFMQFMAYHASSKDNQNLIQNLEIQVGRSYFMENCQWEQELRPYHQYEEERIFNLDNLLMQLEESSESTQHTVKNLKIQFGKLEQEVTKFLS